MPRPEPKQTQVEVVDLPEDTDDDEPVTEWVKKAEFRAFMGGAHISKDGVLSMTISVPMEDKYLALPITDVQSVLMVFSVYEPTQAKKDEDDLDKVWAGS